MLRVTFIMIVSLAAMSQDHGTGDSSKTAARIEQLVEQLGRDDVSSAGKQAIEDELAAAGKPAIPILIAHLDDARTFGRRDMQNYIGAQAGNSLAPKYADITVGSECRKLLERIITPSYHSPFEPQEVRKPKGPFFQVTDWNAWWQKRRGQTLEQIHREMQTVIDRYWQEGGTTQLLP